MTGWFRQYAPKSVLAAARTLADHVDFWEEEAFRSVDGGWRPRELTAFIEGYGTADPSQEQRFRNILQTYVKLASRTRSTKRVESAIVQIKGWLHHIRP